MEIYLYVEHSKPTEPTELPTSSRSFRTAMHKGYAYAPMSSGALQPWPPCLRFVLYIYTQIGLASQPRDIPQPHHHHNTIRPWRRGVYSALCAPLRLSLYVHHPCRVSLACVLCTRMACICTLRSHSRHEHARALHFDGRFEHSANGNDQTVPSVLWSELDRRVPCSVFGVWLFVASARVRVTNVTTFSRLTRCIRRYCRGFRA